MSKPEGPVNIDLTKAQAVQVDLNGNARRLTLADVMEQHHQNNRDHINRIMQELTGGHNNLLNIMPIVEPPERIEAANSVEAGTYRDDATDAVRGAAGFFQGERHRFSTTEHINRLSDSVMDDQARRLNRRINEITVRDSELPTITHPTPNTRAAVIRQYHQAHLGEIFAGLGIQERHYGNALSAIREEANRHGWPVAVYCDNRDGSFTTNPHVATREVQLSAYQAAKLQARQREVRAILVQQGYPIHETLTQPPTDSVFHGRPILDYSDVEWHQEMMRLLGR